MREIIVETSARHIHLTQASLEILCGKGASLASKRFLSQPGQFLSTTKLDLVGPRKTITGVSVLGPLRKADQVEVSKTDARTLGVDAPIRESGHIEGSAPIRIVGPCGTLDLKEGLIVAKRHIHMTPADAAEFGVHDGETVSVKVHTKERRTTFGDVIVRVSDKFQLALHLDTDEANACNATGVVMGEIIKE